MEITGMFGDILDSYNYVKDGEKQEGKIVASFELLNTKLGGCIKCEGVLDNIWKKNTPLMLSGEVEEKSTNIYSTDKEKVFIFNSCEITKDNKWLITLANKDITDSQLQKALSINNGSPFEEKQKSLKVLTNKDNYLNDLIKAEETSRILLSAGVAVTTIEDFLEKNIDIEKNLYITFAKYMISMGKADKVKELLNEYDEYGIERLCGYVLSGMNLSLYNGNTCETLQSLTVLVNRLFKAYKTSTVITDMITKMCVLKINELSLFKHNDTSYVYFTKVLGEEESILFNIKRLTNLTKNTGITVDSEAIKKVEEELGFTYNKEQIDAFNLLKTPGIKILTGPAGSGKTAVIKGITTLAKNAGKTVKICATTGHAASIIADGAETAHKMFGINPFEGDYESLYSLSNPIPADLIICDESSMLDISVAQVILSSISSDTIFLLSGDDNQLMPVSYGNFFFDVINSKKVPIYRLQSIMRQSDGNIIINANKVINGDKNLQKGADFELKNRVEISDVITYLQSEIAEHGDKCQIITPIKDGDLGTHNLNEKLRPKGKKILVTYGNTYFCLGDKVILTKNNYEEGGYINGDMGVITGYINKYLIIDLGERSIYLKKKNLCDLSLAYALTIHKAQGSEYDYCYIVLPKTRMLSRRLLYTAVTRAKKKCVILEYDTINSAIENTHEVKRQELLLERLLEQN